MNKSSSPLLHLYLHLLHFLIMDKSSIKVSKFLQKFKISKFFKKKKINQNFQFLEKIQDFQIFQKKKKNHQSKFSIPSKNSRFPKFFKKTKKIQKSKKNLH